MAKPKEGKELMVLMALTGKEKRQCPKCRRSLVKERIRGIKTEWTPRYNETFKYYKCRVCQYREDSKGKVLTAPGGVLVASK